MTNCIRCGKTLDMHTCIEEKGAKPKEGDMTMCVYCGELYSFNENTEIVSMTDEQSKKFADESPEQYLFAMLTSAKLRMLYELGINPLDLKVAT